VLAIILVVERNEGTPPPDVWAALLCAPTKATCRISGLIPQDIAVTLRTHRPDLAVIS
jgi:hypothetical protein